jgi:Leu/Phe-tRNA-protein transferase
MDKLLYGGILHILGVAVGYLFFQEACFKRAFNKGWNGAMKFLKECITKHGFTEEIIMRFIMNREDEEATTDEQ